MATIHTAYLVPTGDTYTIPEMGLAYLASATTSEAAIAKVRAQWHEAEGNEEEDGEAAWAGIVDATNHRYGGGAAYALYCVAQDD